jgi:ABC-type transport system involved in multi-copper enzyme maturation permease subunit
VTAALVTPHRPRVPEGRDGFAQLVRAEWVKFRTVRGWVTGMIVAALAMVGFGVAVASGSVCSVGPFPGQPKALACTVPLGPGGEAVADHFYFVHRTLAGNGGITVRMTSLAGGPGTSGLQPWSKAGIILKRSLRPGSAYAAMMVTPGHGVRMQYDYTGDTAGPVSSATPRWLRLVRDGDTITGYDSADGLSWARVGTVTLAGLPADVQAGLFATSPEPVADPQLGTRLARGDSQAVATFDRLGLAGTWQGGAWDGTDVDTNPGPLAARLGGYSQAGGVFTVSGSGDIAPSVSGNDGGLPIAHALSGVFAGLIAVAVVAAMFITAEYRRGLIRLTLAASPRRGRVLAAKAIVIGAVTFAAGLAGAAAAVPLGERTLRRNGNFIDPVTTLTELRVVAGTAALLAVAAVFALALGAALRSGTGAVNAVIAGIVLPYLLAVASPVLPAAAADWLMRLTPAAAFAVQGTSQQYPQVDNAYLPFFGYYPLPPWAGFAVLCGYAALAYALAVFLLNRRDA